MNHLLRELAPVTDDAWAQIEEEATRSVTHYLAARRLVDFRGPLGCGHLLGRRRPGGSARPRCPGRSRGGGPRVAPLVELRVPFTLDPDELAGADRGAVDLDLDAVIAAARSTALAEDRLVFHGFPEAGVAGIIPSSPHEKVAIGDDYSTYPVHVAKAVAVLRAADVGGPYAIALGDRCYTGVTETTEHGGYPVLHHLAELLGGPVVWAPAVDGAVVLSQRGGDFELVVGQDVALGHRSSDASSVDLYLEESLNFRVATPEAAVHLAHQ